MSLYFFNKPEIEYSIAYMFPAKFSYVSPVRPFVTTVFLLDKEALVCLHGGKQSLCLDSLTIPFL